jgi:hypothetical protein
MPRGFEKLPTGLSDLFRQSKRDENSPWEPAAQFCVFATKEASMREFLRKKARALELLARSCFDLDTARRLRLMADEFQTVADTGDVPEVPAFMSGAGGRENGGLDRH